ncbi:MAG: hypothetical protein HZB18_02165 [Chloroflexi bacterium]|nr:hypothetical protein [Chloroflexota bacterium]
MKKLKENKPLRYILGIVFFMLLCCNLTSLALCSAQDNFRPPNTEVLVSACKHPIATGVPGGEVLFVHEVRTGKMYLLDLRTGEKRKVPNDPLLLKKGVFLSSDLAWLEGNLMRPEKAGYRPHYILDLTDGKRYELLDLDTLPRLEGGKFDPKNYAYIQSAQYIYIHHSKNTLIALSSDFRTNPNGRVVFSGFAIGADFADGLVRLTKNFNMDYEIIYLGLYHTNISSPTDKYVVRNDGIYFSGTNFSIVDREYTGGRFMGGYFKGWYYDESAVVAQGAGYYLLSFPGVSSIYYVPSPILKLNLP